MNPLLSALLSAGLIDAETANRINRQLDDEAGRAYAEQQLLTAFGAALRGQQERVVELLRTRQGRPAARELLRFWDREETLLWNGVRETILDVASERGIASVIRTGSPALWEKVNEQVIAWAEGYYLDADAEAVGSIPNLNLTSRTAFERAFVAWQRDELEDVGFEEGLPALIQSLETAFGRTRAEAISVTETTRIFTESKRQAADANPFIVGFTFRTALDEQVSEFCRSGEGLFIRKGETLFPDGKGFPPRHVRCRSDISEETEATLAIPSGDAING